VELLQPVTYGAVAHAQDVGNARGFCEQGAWNVFERMKEDVVYEGGENIENCLGNVSSCVGGREYCFIFLFWVKC
jgi:hypothetical protein